MSHRTRLLGCVAAMVLLPAGAAFAQGVAGTFSGAYASADDGTSTQSGWGLNGALAFPFGGSVLNGEVSAGYGQADDTSIWSIGGSVFGRWANSRAGVSVGYSGVDDDTVPLDINITNYGVFGEFYPGAMFTVGASGGGFSVSDGGGDGYYLGGGVTGYLTPNLALSGGINYADADGTTATVWTGGAEYQFSETTPIAVFGSISSTSLDGGGSADVTSYLIGLRFYTGGAGTLVSHHRNGTLGGLVANIANSFF